jgi:hypothetical protein
MSYIQISKHKSSHYFLYKLNSSKKYFLTLERVFNADNGSSSFRLKSLAFSAFHSSVFLSIIHCLIFSLSQPLPTAAALSPADVAAALCALAVRIEERKVPSGDLKAAVSPLRHSILSHNQFSARILIYMCNAQCPFKYMRGGGVSIPC